EDTEDVVQEVFLAAHRALPAYRGESRLSTWLHRIAVNRALNFRERAAEKMRRASQSADDPPGAAEEGTVLPFPALASDGPSPLQELEAKELRRRLADCLKKLPAAWRAALALRDGESLPYEEIARTLEIALGTVRSRLARARLALRRCVEGGTT
ncbi:MAG: sigma-70 family RNA polymerase sigma factor, partial [Acidobacteriota bacterium]